MNYEVGKRLIFPDGDTAVIIRNEYFKDEEDTKGSYDAIRVTFVIEGDEDKTEFDEILDSRDDYRFNTMKTL